MKMSLIFLKILIPLAFIDVCTTGYTLRFNEPDASAIWVSRLGNGYCTKSLKATYLPDLKGRRYFLRCQFGILDEYKCPLGKIFSFKSFRCLTPVDVAWEKGIENDFVHDSSILINDDSQFRKQLKEENLFLVPRDEGNLMDDDEISYSDEDNYDDSFEKEEGNPTPLPENSPESNYEDSYEIKSSNSDPKLFSGVKFVPQANDKNIMLFSDDQEFKNIKGDDLEEDRRLSWGELLEKYEKPDVYDARPLVNDIKVNVIDSYDPIKNLNRAEADSGMIKINNLADTETDSGSAPDWFKINNMADTETDSGSAPDWFQINKIANTETDSGSAPDWFKINNMADTETDSGSAPDWFKINIIPDTDTNTGSAPDWFKTADISSLNENVRNQNIRGGMIVKGKPNIPPFVVAFVNFSQFLQTWTGLTAKGWCVVVGC